MRVMLIWLITAITVLFHGCAVNDIEQTKGTRLEEILPGAPAGAEKGIAKGMAIGAAVGLLAGEVAVGHLYNNVAVRIFYVTDRNQTKNTEPAKFFGADRGELSYGICYVNIPRDHRMGVLESPSMWKLQFREDPEKHVMLLSILPMEKNQYFAELGTHIRTSLGKNAFVFGVAGVISRKFSVREIATKSLLVVRNDYIRKNNTFCYMLFHTLREM